MIRFWLSRLLPILAIVGMVIGPIAVPAGAGGIAAAAMTMAPDAVMSADMPCCPSQQQQQMPDCGKATCPFLTVCSAKCFPNGSAVNSVLPQLILGVRQIDLRDEDQLSSLVPSPPTRPPRI